MEYLDGMSLTDYLDRCGGKLSPGEALGIALPVLDALHAVHGSGIVHRDVCPDNIFVLKDGGVRLIDFGSALLSMKGSDDSRTRISNPGYDSPELQTVGEKADIRTDIYSTGAVLYRMLTGFPPEDASDRLVQDTAVPPGNIVQVPENIDKAVMRSISPDKNLRFSSAEEFKEALIGAKKVRSADEESVRRRKNKVLITAVSSVLALILLGAGAVYGLLWKFVAPTTLNIVLPEYDYNLKNESLRVLFDPDGAEDESIAAEFLRQYPQVKLSVEWVPEEQYADRLTLMISEGSTPDLFYAPEVNDLITSAAADTSAVLSEISDDDSMSTEAIAAIQNLFPTGRYLPTGINPAVIYVNSNVVRGDSLNLPGSGSGINEFAGVCDADGESMLLIPEGNLYAVLIGTDGWSGDLSPEVIIPDGYEALICSDEDAFAALADGSAAFVLGSYSDYRLVQNALPGFYAVESVQNMPAGFSGLFCIGSDGGRAAEKFALLLYSHTAQSALNIGAFCTLPLREDTSELFASIYPEFNEIGGTDISSMTPVGETFYSFDDYFTDIPA